MGKIIAAFLFLVTWVIIGLTCYSSIEALIKSINAGKWPTVDGVIKSSQIKSGPHSNGTTHEAEIIYEYEVDGISYTGDNVGFGYKSGSKKSYGDAQAVLDHFVEAKIIVVRYDPSDHQISTLLFGAHKTIMYDLGYLFFAFIIATLFLRFMIPQMLASQEDP